MPAAGGLILAFLCTCFGVESALGYSVQVLVDMTLICFRDGWADGSGWECGGAAA